MIREIGSIFPLSETYRSQEKAPAGEPGEILYSLCREALYDLAVHCACSGKKVLIPAYTCQTVITPFQEAGGICHFYGIRRDLRINTEHLEELVQRVEPALVVVHPYFGMCLDAREVATLERISLLGVRIVMDCTQCIFSARELPFVDFFVGSYRKWYPIPDGAFLYPARPGDQPGEPCGENDAFVSAQADAMYLRGRYFENGDSRIKAISIRLSKLADNISERRIVPHRMSTFSTRLRQAQDNEMVQRQRWANYTFLYENLRQERGYRFVLEQFSEVTSAPLYFVIYVNDRVSLQKRLVEHRIYAPVLWPVEDDKVLIDEDVRYIYDHLLAIPCDQRYDASDMRRVVDAIDNL